MMVKIHSLDSYTIKKDDKFLFNTNILMYMHCSIGGYNPKIVEAYSDFYQKTLVAESDIYISTLLISEFVNAYSRLEFNIARKNDGLSDFKKDFRSNPKYKDLLDNINLLTEKKILKNSIKIQDEFNKFNESRFFENPTTYDFNDEYYCYLAETLNFKIVTHDKDFKKTNYDIEIITKS